MMSHFLSSISEPHLQVGHLGLPEAEWLPTLMETGGLLYTAFGIPWCSHALLLSPAVSVQVWPKATVQEGQLVNLTCLVWTTHMAQLTYTWYQDGQQRPGAVHSIPLPNVTVMDAASYRCGVLTLGQTLHLSRPVTLDVLCECGWMQGGAGRNNNSLQGSGHGQSLTGIHPRNSVPSWLMEYWTRSIRVWGQWGREAVPQIGQVEALGGGEPRPSWLECHLQTGLLTTVVPELLLCLCASIDAPRSMRLTYLLESRGGQLALVLCTVDSRPPAQLALSHAGRLLVSSTTASVPNTLRLELWEPRPSDEGLYSCSARSPLGQANMSLELRLEGKAGR